jgi:predicted CXXCH cytochrome family protein
VSSFFPGSATTKLAYAQAFDTKCGSRSTGCHTRATPPSHVGEIHPNSTVAPYDNVLIFGRTHGGTTPTPKAYSWYPVIASAADYAARFYETPAVWLIQDITTNSNSGSFADNATNYGTCVTCHDPHGTNAPVNFPGATTNFMLRGDAYTAPSFFCNTVCHGN